VGVPLSATPAVIMNVIIQSSIVGVMVLLAFCVPGWVALRLTLRPLRDDGGFGPHDRGGGHLDQPTMTLVYVKGARWRWDS